MKPASTGLIPGPATPRRRESRRVSKPSVGVHPVGGLVLDREVQERRLGPGANPAHDGAHEPRGEPLAPVRGVGADRADLRETWRMQALAGHRDQLVARRGRRDTCRARRCGSRTARAGCARPAPASRARRPAPSRTSGCDDGRRRRRGRIPRRAATSAGTAPRTASFQAVGNVQHRGARGMRCRPARRARARSSHASGGRVVGERGEHRDVGLVPGRETGALGYRCVRSR